MVLLQSHSFTTLKTVTSMPSIDCRNADFYTAIIINCNLSSGQSGTATPSICKADRVALRKGYEKVHQDRLLYLKTWTVMCLPLNWETKWMEGLPCLSNVKPVSLQVFAHKKEKQVLYSFLPLFPGIGWGYGQPQQPLLEQQPQQPLLEQQPQQPLLEQQPQQPLEQQPLQQQPLLQQSSSKLPPRASEVSSVSSVSEAKKSSEISAVPNLKAAKAAIAARESITISSESELDDCDFLETNSNLVSKETGQANPNKKKKVAEKNSAGKPVGARGRPQHSKNKTVPKNALVQRIKELTAKGSASVINTDSVSEPSARNLRSRANKSDTSSWWDTNSSDLCSSNVDIGFDFTPKKPLDPEMLEKMEACIVKTNATWEDVIGLPTVKQRLREAAVLPILRPDLFVGFRAASKGVLLYGPPGTGKTMLAKCAASSGNCTFFSLTSSDIMSKWLGEAEKCIATLFHLARQKQPSIIFIDEIDSLLTTRGQGEHDSIRRIKTEFLAQWDGLSNEKDAQIMVLGATNRPMDLDQAAMRRFGQHLYVPLPDLAARKAMFERFANSKDIKVNLSHGDISHLGLKSSQYSAADIANVIKDACMAPLRELSFEHVKTVLCDELRPVCKQDLDESLKIIKATCQPESIQEIEAWSRR
ncbi:fidgetin-like protein 1 [Thrips palmi]|uniref:Fidgetin-like protein 1 n=1 Tax=Thrips palmi TaxID=161013 RepID=A0A6P8ZZS9_THRPL|nr:fidgetin-like protein 1 [Thrips palmi]